MSAVFLAANGYAVGGNGYPFAVFDAAVQFHHQGGIQICNLNQADVFRARFLQGFVERLCVFAVYQHIEPEAFMVRHQRAADFGVAQVRAGENLPAYRIAHLRINAVRVFQYQIFITDLRCHTAKRSHIASPNAINCLNTLCFGKTVSGKAV